MAEIVWTDPALSDLEAIADYIAIDKPDAAAALVRRIFDRVERLSRFPLGGARLPELSGSRYRQLVEPPCRVIYRADRKRVFIIHVTRGERRLRPDPLG